MARDTLTDLELREILFQNKFQTGMRIDQLRAIPVLQNAGFNIAEASRALGISLISARKYYRDQQLVDRMLRYAERPKKDLLIEQVHSSITRRERNKRYFDGLEERLKDKEGKSNESV